MSKPVAKNKFKYGMPLYGAAWPEGDVVFMAGGGGQGIQNRLVFARYKRTEHELLDQIGQFNFGSSCATRTLLHPRGKLLLVALSSGELRCFHVDTRNPRIPRVSEVTGDLQQQLKTVNTGCDVKCMSFNSSGDLLAVGYEGGEVVVLDWPSLANTEFHLSGETALKGDVKDVDFGQGPQKQLLALCSQSGQCEVWQLAPPSCLARLKAPAALPQTRLDRCRFSRDGPPTLYTMAIGPAGTHLLAWAQPPGKQELGLQRSCLVSKQPSIALEISPDGSLLAVAGNEGDIHVVSIPALRPFKVAKKAHMVFPTGVTFSRDSQFLLSISMDASAHVMDLQPPPPQVSWFMLLSLLVLILAALVACVLQLLDSHYRGGASTLHPPTFQEPVFSAILPPSAPSNSQGWSA